MADQVSFVPAEETSAESPLAVAVVSEQEMPPAPQELIVQIPDAPGPDIRRRRPRIKKTARKSVMCR